MYDVEREKKILEVLEQRGTIGVNRLAEIVFCSGSTIRRDLSRLEKKGLIKRTFGAVSLANTFATDETSFSVREIENIAKKKRLSKEAAEHLKSNQTIFIDSSTTLFNIVPYLNSFKNLLIVTNGVKIASEISYRTNHKLIMIGGSIDSHTNSTIGSSSLSQLNGLHFDVAIMSCAGATIDFGFSEASYEMAELKKSALNNATTKIMVFDESKFGKNKAFQSAHIQSVNLIITTPELDDSIVDDIKKLGVNVIKAKPEAF